jgi:prepilin-type N-terminal cleavage/methylation domain-containing protein
MNRVHNQQGFTLVELMLAMAFVSALLLAIAMTVIQIGNIYNRGITYKSVNQAGSALASELQRDINSNSPFDLDSTNPYRIVKKDWGGRLCIGDYSYIWNYGKTLNDSVSDKNKYKDGETKKIVFVKASDPTASYCDLSNSDIDINGAVELLDVGNNNLALHSFSITPSAYESLINQRVYNISFLIGTNKDTTLTADSSACLSPDNANSDPIYCAVNQFDILARAGNSASK